ncbi:VOC family protein [Streptomyces sp. NPDC101225]|uniref:VOC family protein n=1 Tax=Streptomyces sp. NPDC101225 TaxID=3366135 RepID=UPI0037F7F40C
MASIKDIVFDSPHPASSARFWAQALDDYDIAPYDEEELTRLRSSGINDPEDDPTVLLVGPDGRSPRIFFQLVAEDKRAKNRVHLDLSTTDAAAAVKRLCAHVGDRHAFPLPGARHSLVGLRRRAKLHGGTATPEPTAGGGYELRLEWPANAPHRPLRIRLRCVIAILLPQTNMNSWSSRAAHRPRDRPDESECTSMRRSLKPAVGLICAMALACAGCSSGGDDSTTATDEAAKAAPSLPSSSTSSTPLEPYVSATTASDTDAAGSPSTYNLAFVLSNGSSCAPKWSGTYPISNSAVRSRIASLKKSGAEVRVSFGGANGTELAQTCHSAATLAEAYAKALDAAGATQADFDLEGGALTDSASIDLRSQAIAILQKKRTDLKVSFTLAVTPDGIGDGGLAVLDSAHTKAVTVSTVNIMAMDYGTSYTGDMSDYAISAAKATHDQLKDVFALSPSNAWHALALTSMIGVNDVAGETFTLSDAADVRTFAEDKGLAWVSMWATYRDRQCADGTSTTTAQTDCSGVEQKNGAFAEALAG